ncbi:MAG: peroxide stress protein YaaA [Deltaproteobacteria bacterium]|nr:peroxide stress protein YaaA [Deltaproteobacteria bacterium]
MLSLLSPAKKLDMSPAPKGLAHTRPALLRHTDALMDTVAQLGAADLQRLMGLSDALAELNLERFATFSRSRRATRGHKQAALAFAGDVYQGMAVNELGPKAIEFAQDHIRILSGLYGLLRPLDLIQPYRLEMGTRLANPRGSDLYAFWGDTIRDAISQTLRSHRAPIVVNLASTEYARAARLSTLDARVVTPQFKERRGDEVKVISFSAKRARGMMARFIAAGRIDRPEALLRFSEDGYAFDEGLSEDDTWVFVRDAPG